MLRNNNFEFNENHYLQTLGTAIRTKMAPSYANLFMDRLERRLLSQAQVKPYIWLPYIDDVLMVWTGTELELVELLNYISEARDTIKFTWDWSRERIKVSATLQHRPRADRCSVSCFYKNPDKPYIL